MLRLIADEAGLPDTAGGCFVSGGSAGNLSALAVARETAKKRLGDAAAGRRLRVVVGTDAHSSIVNTLRLLEMDALVVETPDHRLTAETRPGGGRSRPTDVRRRRGGRAPRAPPTPGIVDDLAGVGAIARERGWWFHVDGAYGGSGHLRPVAASRSTTGIEQADSFILDPHKWLFTPFDCCALLYRDPELARATHTQDASYLDVIHVVRRRVEPDRLRLPPDPARARAAAVVLAGGVRRRRLPRGDRGRRSRLARETAELIKATPHLELIREPDLGVVLFRRIGWKADGLRRVGAAAARRGGRVHPAEQVGGRDGRPVRVPAPRHKPGPGARGPGPDRVSQNGRPAVAVPARQRARRRRDARRRRLPRRRARRRVRHAGARRRRGRAARPGPRVRRRAGRALAAAPASCSRPRPSRARPSSG